LFGTVFISFPGSYKAELFSYRVFNLLLKQMNSSRDAWILYCRRGLFNDIRSCLDYTAAVVCELMSEEHWWNYVDRGESVKSVFIR
jgi:hypothetical protein